MSSPTSRKELKERILRDLGAPLNKINVSDDQIEDKIDDALKLWRDYHYDAVERRYIATQVTQEILDNQAIQLPNEVVAVTRVLPAGVFGNTNDVLSAQYQLVTNLIMNNFMYTGLQQFYITMSYLQMVQEMFQHVPTIEFRRHDGRLKLTVDWNRYKVGDWIVAEVTAFINENNFAELWGDLILIRYAAALVKKQWGVNLGKFAGIQLPGNVTLNAAVIKEEAEAEIAKLEQDLLSKWRLPDDFYIG